MKKRFLALMIALLMVLQLCPVTALAVDSTPEVRTFTNPVQYNPLYPDRPHNAPQYNTNVDAPVYLAGELSYETQYDQIVAAVRAAMVNRVNNISVQFTSKTDVLDGDMLDSLVYDAMEHTGVPTEGDSLAFVWSTYGTGGSVSYSGGLYHVTANINMQYYTNAQQEAQLTSKVNSVMQSFGFNATTTDYQKIKTIYDYITANVRYDYDHLNDPNYDLMFTAYAALINGTSVCQGYAVLFYRMCLEAGVNARVIGGIGNGGPHAWNIVLLDGKYYNLDSTWDEGEKTYSWFLKGRSDFPDHYRDAEFDTAAYHAAHPMAASAFNPATAHTHKVVTSAAVAATCTKTGLTEGSYCSTCGTVFVAQQVVPMKAHTPITIPAIAATCTATGLTEGKHCSVCNAVIKAQETVPVKAHTESDWIIDKAATTAAEGSKHTECTVCKATLDTAVIPKVEIPKVEYSVTVKNGNGSFASGL